MSIQMVNGYSCASCADVSLAKRGIDPHEDTGAPVAATNVISFQRNAPEAVLPNAVDAAGSNADVRAKLDYAANIDILV